MGADTTACVWRRRFANTPLAVDFWYYWMPLFNLLRRHLPSNVVLVNCLLLFYKHQLRKKSLVYLSLFSIVLHLLRKHKIWLICMGCSTSFIVSFLFMKSKRGSIILSFCLTLFVQLYINLYMWVKFMTAHVMHNRPDGRSIERNFCYSWGLLLVQFQKVYWFLL